MGEVHELGPYYQACQLGCVHFVQRPNALMIVSEHKMLLRCQFPAVVYDANRMEDTFSRDSVQGNTVQTILQY